MHAQAQVYCFQTLFSNIVFQAKMEISLSTLIQGVPRRLQAKMEISLSPIKCVRGYFLDHRTIEKDEGVPGLSQSSGPLYRVYLA